MVLTHSGKAQQPRPWRATAHACTLLHTRPPAQAGGLCLQFQLECSQCLSWLKEGAQRHGTKTKGRPGRLGAPRTRWVMAWQPTGITCVLPSHALHGYLPQKLGPQSWDPPKLFFLNEDATSGDQDSVPSQTAIFLFATSLSSSSDPLPCLPTSHACLP
jgi:hypothetical protein